MRNLLKNIRSFLPRNIIYCDVGARWGADKPWNDIRDVVDFIGFEPDAEEYISLMDKKCARDAIYPYALYCETGEFPLYLTNNRRCSSLYRPNYAFLNKYPDQQRFEIDETITIEAVSLDSLYRQKILSRADFIKIDVQGAELDILKGGRDFLSDNVIGIEVEVEFQRMYDDQPLFSDVDKFVRESLGLEIQDLRKTYWKYPEGIGFGGVKGQLIFGDALYFRPPHEMVAWCSSMPREESSSKLQMACLMGIVYGYLDYSLSLLSQPNVADFIDEHVLKSWRLSIYRYGKTLKYGGKGSGILSDILNSLYRIFQPVHKGWASTGHHLGTRKKYGIFG